MSHKDTPKKTVSVKAWAWVYTEPTMQKQPVIAVDETKTIITEIKRKHLAGTNSTHTNLLRSLYRQSKIVPITITYKL